MRSFIVRSLFAGTIFLPSVASSQGPDSAKEAFRDSVIVANSHRGTFANGRLQGDAAAFLLREAEAAQFVLIGERHDIKEIPEIAQWLLNDLHSRAGFNYLATENGEIALELGLRQSQYGGADSAIAFATRYPNAFEFASDQDLTLVGSAARMLGKIKRPVWGLDQEFGASHLLDQLRRLPATPAARKVIDSLDAIVSAKEHLRFDAGGEHWMGVESRPEIFRDLLHLYGDRPDPRAKKILEQLEISARLYELNRRASKGEPVGFTGNDDREQMMRRNFVKDYAEAVRGGVKFPKVLVKMGQAHAGRGQSPFGPFSVGDLVSNMATANGTKSFHIAVLAQNAKADTLAPSLWKWPDMLPLAEASPIDGITIIDLRPIRPLLYSNRLGTIGPDLRRAIYAFDAVMLIGGASDATAVLTKQPKR